MQTPRDINHQEKLIKCLNHLETIKLKMPRFQKHKSQIQRDLVLIIDGIKEYLHQSKNRTMIIRDQQEQIARIKQEKNHMNEKHNQILEALQMLIYQGDQEEMKKKIDYYKAKPLDESFLTFVTQEISHNGSTLNRAFVMDSEEEKGYSQFSRLQEDNSQTMVQDQLQRVKLQSALKLIKDEEQPFDKREQAWLGIIYTKNAKQQSEIFDSGRVLNSYSSRNLPSLSQITLTQQCQMYSKDKNKHLMTFSGKKIKSMSLLKEKSAKKKSIPKTSVKKNTDNQKDLENAEGSDEKFLKKKLNFAQKTNEKDSKKKCLKNQENFIARSFKKQFQSHN